MSEKISFAMNFANKFEIDVTPGEAAPTYEPLAAGISSMEPSGNEEIAQDPYYDGKGMSSSDVTGGQITITVSGHRKYGDPAQDFIASRAYQYGEARKTRFRWTQPNGDTLEGWCTLANISPGSELGDANAKGTFSFEIHMNGLPTFTPGAATAMPEEIELQAVTVTVGASSKATPTVTPENCSKACIFEIADESVATVDAEGNVTGVKEGSTKLTAYAAAKPSVNATADVTVSEAS